MKRILYIEGCKDGTVRGSHISLFSMVANIDRKEYHPIVVFYDDHVIATRLRELGVETHILKKYTALDFRKIINSTSPRLASIVPALIPFQKAVNLLWYLVRPALIYIRYLTKYNIDIVHLNNSLNNNHEWMLAAKLSGVKIISHERSINERLPRMSRLLGGMLDLHICITKAVSYPLIKQGLAESKIKVVYNGIDMSKMKINSPPEDIKSLYHINDVPVKSRQNQHASFRRKPESSNFIWLKRYRPTFFRG
jgi:glycosyltransferase involved in cell wall biosynthesis